MNYYISNTGNDANNGTSEATPWQTFNNVTPTLLQPGDMLWLKGGQNHTGRLLIESTGTVSQPIFISSDSRADIYCNTGDGVRLINPEYIFVNNLKVIGSDAGRTTNATVPTSAGCGITAVSTRTTGAKLKGVRIANTIVTGTRTGILFQADQGFAPQDSFQGFEDISITHNEVYNCALTGIFFWARPGATHGDDYGKIYPQVGFHHNVFSNVYVARNNVYDCYGYNTTTWSVVAFGTGIRLMNCHTGTVEYNRVDNCGHSGAGIGYPANFEAEFCDSVIWQYNQSSRCRQVTISRDGAGFDVFDGGVINCIAQYNYAFLNDGYGLGGGGNPAYHPLVTMGNNIARFNILVNNNVHGNEADLEIWGDSYDMKFYNNIIYNDRNDGGKLIWCFKPMPNSYIANNILVSLGNKVLYLGEQNQSIAPKLLNNLYWRGVPDNLGIYYANHPFEGNITGTSYNSLTALRTIGQETLNGQNYGLNADPLFVSPGAMPTFLPAQEVKFMTAYNLLAGSPALGAGVDFSGVLGNIGAVDFHGNTFSSYSIGAHQPGVTVAPPVTVSGSGLVGMLIRMM